MKYLKSDENDISVPHFVVFELRRNIFLQREKWQINKNKTKETTQKNGSQTGVEEGMKPNETERERCDLKSVPRHKHLIC